jgi:hypothetical protein
MLAVCRKRQFSGVYVGNECDKQDESHAISIYRKLHGSRSINEKSQSEKKKGRQRQTKSRSGPDQHQIEALNTE